MNYNNLIINNTIDYSITRNKKFLQKNELEKYFIKEIEEGKFNAFITLSPNLDKVRFTHLENKIRHWANDVCMRVFRNSYYYEKDGSKFTYKKSFYYYGFFETGEGKTNPHYHLIAYVHPDKIETVKKLTDKFWKKQYARGSSDFQIINSDSAAEISSYALKDFGLNNDKYIIR